VSFVTAAILAYVVLQLGIAVWVSRRVRTEQDYLVAGRALGYGLSVFTVFATWFGAETCVGASARAYGGGLADTNADPVGYALCLVVMATVFAVPLYRRGITTLADLYRQRWGGGVERLAALVLVPGSVLWAAAQIRAFGMVLGASSSISADTMIVVAGAVVIVYTAAGGLLADALADLVQGVVLIVGLVVLAVAVLTGDGPGLGAITADQLAPFSAERPLLATLEGWAVPIFGSLAAQELVAKVLAARSEVVARRSMLAATALYLAVGSIPPVLGLVAVHALPAGTDGEQALARLADAHLPAALYVLFSGALVAAILSTVDSALLAAGSLIAHNVVVPLRPGLSERGVLRINRACVVGFGVVACGLALTGESVFALVETASSLGTSGALWLIVLALWSARFGGPAAASACLVGGVATYVAGGTVLGLEYPFLASLAVSLLLYVATAVLEDRGRPAPVTG
jgi:Na+/proline symporter